MSVVYCLVLADDPDQAKRRDELDSLLTGMGKPDRATWGLLPSHQREQGAALAIAQGVAEEA